MSRDGDINIRDFIDSSNKFQGKMSEFKDNTERRLLETNTRLISIEKDITSICLDHKTVTQMYNTLRESVLSQEKVNVGQENRNVSVNNWQNKQDESIRGLEEDKRFVEYKMSNRDITKIITAIAAILIPSVTLIIFIVGKFM